MHSHTLLVGGLTAAQLQQALQHAGVQLNAYAQTLLASPLFKPSSPARELSVQVLSVGELGLLHGARMVEVLERAAQRGLYPGPHDLAPLLRLHIRDQEPAPTAERPGHAPYGAITVISTPLTNDDDFPKGFYLRNVAGQLWLRGHCWDAQQHWQPDACLALCQA
ncbi:hypothetical protein HNQ51_000345 [Inhella inkyongensis]|uniref:Helicase n=1 Tax=Inhella inkyongensis TaxID=392593 RepID=A0A840S0L2_9BURK|nr:hypothetical protein [Inhella inkyongensis]MBB5203052.1 hypothetical protein [Inhella inkyongensis]